MFITICLPSLVNISSTYCDHIEVYFATSTGINKITHGQILELMEKSRSWNFNSNDWVDEYYELYHNKLKIKIPSVEDSKPMDELNAQLNALSILKAVGGDCPSTNIPIPHHLAYLQSFYNPVSMENDTYPEFHYKAKKILFMRVTEQFKGMSDTVLLFCCLEPVKTLKLRASCILWLARGYTEYNIDLTPNKNIRELIPNGSDLPVAHKSTFKIVIWNCKNAAIISFKEIFLELVSIQSPSLLIVTETRMAGADVIRILSSLGFDSWVKVDSAGLTGGMWMLWKRSKAVLEGIHCSDEEMQADINIINEASTT